MSKEDGGPAFPTVNASREEDYGTRGMSLRDYFAVNTAVEFDGYGVNYAESIVGRKMPDFAADPISNQAFWADFRARMRYA